MVGPNGCANIPPPDVVINLGRACVSGNANMAGQECDVVTCYCGRIKPVEEEIAANLLHREKSW